MQPCPACALSSSGGPPGADRPHDPPSAAIVAVCDALRERGIDYVFAMVPARHAALAKALGLYYDPVVAIRITVE